MSLKQYGLIGKHLKHSFSPSYFIQKFLDEGLKDHVYSPYELKEQELNEFLTHTKCKGLNVTIPYKETIIPLLDEVDEDAKRISAVNAIKIYEDGNKKGFNTDHTGFRKSLSNWNLKNVSKAMILGSGGASKAISDVLDHLGISYLTISREAKNGELTYNDLSDEQIRDYLLIINCTPLGMYPDIESFPPIPYQAIGKEHFIYDLVYNPDMSKFLEKAEQRGAQIKNGLEMLQIQAEESWRIWNDPTI